MNQLHCNKKKILAGSAMVLAIAASVFAQEKPYTQAGTGQPPPPFPPPPPPKQEAATGEAAAKPAPPPEPNAVEKLFNDKIPEAFSKGKFNLNARLRYEWVEQDGVAAITKNSYAPTLRTRFGFTTAPVYGFQGMIEAENLVALGGDTHYNAAGSNNQNDRPVVADPPTTELNQAWLSYSYTNLLTLKGGRERIVLDNQRFIGDVAWRQNMQTFDAAGAQVHPIKQLSLYYAYIWNVNRVFGDVSGLPPTSPNHDFKSDSHVINVAYDPFKYLRLVGYAYLLDLDLQNGTATANNNSCATYGGFLSGSAPVTEKFTLGYRGEFAWQTEYGNSTLNYEASYYNFELGGNLKPFAFGGGYEVLGSGLNSGAGGGRTGFRTPLATGHAFNGWADVFLNTPNAGLQDIYGFAQVTLPAQIPLRFVYHKFDADNGGGNFGQEFDVVVSRKFGKNWTALLKYAFYDGRDAAPPALAVPNVQVQKFWAQIEFNF